MFPSWKCPVLSTVQGSSGSTMFVPDPPIPKTPAVSGVCASQRMCLDEGQGAGKESKELDR